MKLQIKPNPGATKSRKRVGRGTGSGLGKTSGRGGKGQTARTGGKIPARFEGGQQPLYKRLPKRGFTNALFQKKYVVLNICDLLKAVEEKKITEGVLNQEVLIAKGLIPRKKNPVKLLAKMPTEEKQISLAGITLEVAKASEKAKEIFQRLGGKLVIKE